VRQYGQLSYRQLSFLFSPVSERNQVTQFYLTQQPRLAADKLPVISDIINTWPYM